MKRICAVSFLRLSPYSFLMVYLLIKNNDESIKRVKQQIKVVKESKRGCFNIQSTKSIQNKINQSAKNTKEHTIKYDRKARYKIKPFYYADFLIKYIRR